jgi:hypothetical protein
MRCKDCGAIEVIKVNKPENVKFVCIKGHVWYEEYIDKGENTPDPEHMK